MKTIYKYWVYYYLFVKKIYTFRWKDIIRVYSRWH
jgi:hypothetical protein